MSSLKISKYCNIEKNNLYVRQNLPGFAFFIARGVMKGVHPHFMGRGDKNIYRPSSEAVPSGRNTGRPPADSGTGILHILDVFLVFSMISHLNAHKIVINKAELCKTGRHVF